MVAPNLPNQPEDDDRVEPSPPTGPGIPPDAPSPGPAAHASSGTDAPEPEPGGSPVPPDDAAPPPLPDEGAPPAEPGWGGAGTLPPDLQTADKPREERQWAMFCHLAGLAGILPVVPAIGNVLGPLILWLIKKEESRFIDFHGRQATFFQLAAFVLIFVLGVVGLITWFICIGIIFFLLAGVVWVGAVVYAIVAAIKVSGGEDFEYPYVGPWVREQMGEAGAEL